MRISVLGIIFIFAFYASAESSDIIVLNPVVSEGVEEELVDLYVEIMIKKLKNAGYDVMEIDEREKFFEERGFTPYLIDDRTLEILKKGGIKWVIGGSIIKIKEGYLLTAELWGTKEKERIAYSKWCESDMELLNSVVEILRGMGIEGDFERSRPLKITSAEKGRKYEVEEEISQETSPSKRVSVGGAFLLSIIPGFGAGHFYSHSKLGGTIFLAGELGTIFVGWIWASSAEGWGAFDAIAYSSIIFFSFRIIEIITSIPTAVHYNRSIEKKGLQFSPVFMKDGMGMEIEVRF